MVRLAAALLFLALLLSTGCVRPADSDKRTTTPTQKRVEVYVDTVSKGTIAAYEVDGKTFISVEDAFRLANMRLESSDEAVRVFNQPSEPGLLLYDDKGFQERVNAAVALLRDKAPGHYENLLKNAVGIIPGRGNLSFPEANIIMLSEVDLEKGTVTWLASTLAHEAEHLRIYHEDKRLDATANEEEAQAYRVDIEVLKAVGADPREIEWAEKKLAEYN